MPLFRVTPAARTASQWPAADFVIGNPPFIGASTMRQALGDGYVEALRSVWKEVPDSADFVMFWWHHAAALTRSGKVRRFGFITTNSLTQTFNRKVVQQQLDAKPALSLAFAIPDHPWVDAADGAAVRIAMTVGRAAQENDKGELVTVVQELEGAGEGVFVELSTQRGILHADLTAGANVVGAGPLQANEGLANRGVQLFGAGFIVTPEEAKKLGLGHIFGLEAHIRPYRNGRDLAATPRGVLVIDLFGLTDSEVRDRFPEVYQWVLERVKPERDQNNRATYRDNWWTFGEPRKVLRKATSGLSRYIATVETAKHRPFVFLDQSILPDNKLVAVPATTPFCSASSPAGCMSLGQWRQVRYWKTDQYMSSHSASNPSPFPPPATSRSRPSAPSPSSSTPTANASRRCIPT